MGRPIGPRKVHRYSLDFKLTAVKLSRTTRATIDQEPGATQADRSHAHDRWCALDNLQ
jgi:hypothetical protein